MDRSYRLRAVAATLLAIACVALALRLLIVQSRYRELRHRYRELASQQGGVASLGAARTPIAGEADALRATVASLAGQLRAAEADRAAMAAAAAEERAKLSQLIASSRDEVLSALLAEKVEQITAGADSPQEVCLRIARWLSANISNREDSGRDALDWFVSRAGQCGARAGLFVRMAALRNVHARLFNLYNYGGPGGGHSCVQAWYDGQWHFFDPTYAGVFMRDGKVLSWDEIAADPDAAAPAMVVFPATLDKHHPEDPLQADDVVNTERMATAHAPAAIRNVTAGFLRDPAIKTLRASASLAADDLPLTLGTMDGSDADTTADGMRRKISEQLGAALGTVTDTFHTAWTFTGGEPGRAYTLTFRVINPRPTLAWSLWARPTGARVLAGEAFTIPAGQTTGEWQITFMPTSDGTGDAAPGLLIGHDYTEPGSGVLVDQLELAVLPAGATQPAATSSPRPGGS